MQIGARNDDLAIQRTRCDRVRKYGRVIRIGWRRWARKEQLNKFKGGRM